MKKMNVIVIFDKNHENVLMCKRTKDPYKGMYNLVGGKIEKENDGLNEAYRELEEETGNKASSLKKLGEIYPTCGYSNEIIHIYLALNCKKTKTNFDEDEFIESEFIPLNKIKDMIKKGIIKDAKTICAIYYYELNK